MNHAIDGRRLRSLPEPRTSVRAVVRAALVLGLLFAVGVPSAAVAQSPADRFVQNIESFENVHADARALIHKTWSECDDCDGNEFLTQGLTVLSPKFRDGLDAYDADDYERAATIMSDVAAGKNMFLSVNAAVYEVKSLVQLDRLVEASERIALLSADEDSVVATYSYFAGELEFLRGFCLLSDLQYEDAAKTLGGFLRNYPDASQRLVIAAQQMLAELGNREPGKIGEVVDLMKFCGRRLYHADGSEIVQTRQQRVIDILDRLIEGGRGAREKQLQGWQRRRRRRSVAE